MPIFFTTFVWALPVALGTQFALAGQSLFNGLPWDLHSMVGGLTAIPITTLLIGSLTVHRLRGFRWWAAFLVALYILQISLPAFGSFALALHPFNAALLLVASLVMLAKVERRRRKGIDQRNGKLHL